MKVKDLGSSHLFAHVTLGKLLNFYGLSFFMRKMKELTR